MLRLCDMNFACRLCRVAEAAVLPTVFIVIHPHLEQSLALWILTNIC